MFQERERMEREKDAMRQELESEIAELQTNIKRLQKVESILSESGDKAQKFMEMKTKMQVRCKLNGKYKLAESSIHLATSLTAFCNICVYKFRKS